MAKLGFTVIEEHDDTALGFAGNGQLTLPDGSAPEQTRLFKTLFDQIDGLQKKDGILTTAEVKQAYQDPILGDALRKLVAYHPSEWQGGVDSPKWKKLETDFLYEEQDKPLLAHELQRIRDLTFWDDIPELSQSPFAYHFHPVEFVKTLGSKVHPVVYIDGHPIELEFLYLNDGTSIDEGDYKNAVKKLGCEINAIKAVALTETESIGSYFKLPQSDYVPSILFERHKFKKFTNNIYSKDYPSISGSAGGYSADYASRYKNLLMAYKLDKKAALKSASWGLFQMMGFNYEICGYDSVEEFVYSMSISPKFHFKAFVNYIKNNNNLLTAIQNKNWSTFAKGYNGSGYAKNKYDKKMDNHYNALSAKK